MTYFNCIYVPALSSGLINAGNSRTVSIFFSIYLKNKIKTILFRIVSYLGYRFQVWGKELGGQHFSNSDLLVSL